VSSAVFEFPVAAFVKTPIVFAMASLLPRFHKRGHGAHRRRLEGLENSFVSFGGFRG
jgi:hypothetical protein